MIIAFCGTRQGMTDIQLEHIRLWLEHYKPDLVVHRCREGSDAQFNKMAMELNIKRRGLPVIKERQAVTQTAVPRFPDMLVDSGIQMYPPDLLTNVRPALLTANIILLASKEVVRPNVVPADGVWGDFRFLERDAAKQWIVVYANGHNRCSSDPAKFVRSGPSPVVALQRRVNEAMGKRYPKELPSEET